MAWQQVPAQLPIYGTGLNVVACIHIVDLAVAILHVCELRPDTRYVVAVDDAASSLEDITRAIANALGTAKVRRFHWSMGDCVVK